MSNKKEIQDNIKKMAKDYVPPKVTPTQIACNAIRDMFFHKHYNGKIPVKDMDVVKNGVRWHKVYGKKAIQQAIKELDEEGYMNLDEKKENWLWGISGTHNWIFDKERLWVDPKNYALFDYDQYYVDGEAQDEKPEGSKYTIGDVVFIKSTNAIGVVIGNVNNLREDLRTDMDGMQCFSNICPASLEDFKLKGVRFQDKLLGELVRQNS